MNATIINTRNGVRVGRVVIGLLFVVSAAAKLASIGQFELIMIQQELVSERIVAAYLARILIGVELVVGLCYFQPYYLKRLLIPGTLVLLIGFTGYLGYLQLFTDYKENCGCFGDLIQMTPLESIVKNLVMIGIVGFLYKNVEVSDKERWIIPCVMTAVSVVVIAVAFPVRLITDADLTTSAAGAAEELVPSTSRFAKFQEQGAEVADFNLTDGVCLAAFLSLSCDHCRDVAMELGELRRELPLRINVVFLGDQDEVAGFFEDSYAEFPYIIANPAIFYDYIGNAPPRVYFLNRGEILAYWDLENFSIADIRELSQEHNRSKP